MAIYDLNDSSFFKHDIENNLKVTDTIYELKFKAAGNEHYPKIIVSNENHWTSPTVQARFNDLVPIVKSLVKDMYAGIENVFKSGNGSFNQNDIANLERRYMHFKEFRLINNKFKHYNDTVAEISVTPMALLENDGHHIDVFFNLSYKDGIFSMIRLAQLIDVYLTILEDQKIISIQRES